MAKLQLTPGLYDCLGGFYCLRPNQNKHYNSLDEHFTDVDCESIHIKENTVLYIAEVEYCAQFVRIKLLHPEFGVLVASFTAFNTGLILEKWKLIG
jgi:hypothetical protein